MEGTVIAVLWKNTVYQICLCPTKLSLIVGNQIDMPLFSLIDGGKNLMHPAKGALHSGKAL